MINTLGECNHCWLPGRYYDEVTSEFLCVQHAGALAGHPENCNCEVLRTVRLGSAEADRKIRNHYDPSITSERAA